jgi:GTPase SAR1 family protein
MQRKSKQQVSLVFVGETGSGKTTLLESLKDTIHGIPYEHRSVVPKTEKKGKSQTKECNQFGLTNKEWFVNIIDTPGIADTEGITEDEAHLKKIVDFIIEYGEFNAVCFVIKNGTSRATITMKYVINEIKSMLPKDAKDNFIVCLTNSQSPFPTEDTLAVIQELGLPEDKIVCVNNLAYEVQAINPRATDVQRKLVEKTKESTFSANQAYLWTLIEEASSYKLYKSEGIKNLKLKRDLLKEEIGVLNMKIDSSVQVDLQLDRILSEVDVALKDVEANKNYKITSQISRSIPFKKEGKITTHCNTCNKSCHIDCSLSYGNDLNCCAAMYGTSCQSCGCSVNYHCHLGWDQRIEYQTVIGDDPNKKDRFEKAEGKRQYLKEEQEKLQKLKHQEEKTRRAHMDRISALYTEINQMAMIGHNYVYVDYLECQIKQLDKSSEPKEVVTKKKSFLKEQIERFSVFLKCIANKLT